MTTLKMKVDSQWVPVGVGPGVAPGGTTGQVLTKKSAADYDTQWANTPPILANNTYLQGYASDGTTVRNLIGIGPDNITRLGASEGGDIHPQGHLVFGNGIGVYGKDTSGVNTQLISILNDDVIHIGYGASRWVNFPTNVAIKTASGRWIAYDRTSDAMMLFANNGNAKFNESSGTTTFARTVMMNASVDLQAAGTNLPAYSAPIRVGFLGGAAQVGIALRPSADNTNAILFYNAANTSVGSVLTTPTGTAYNTTSDGRLKDDRRRFDAGPIIDSLTVYDFAWKATGERAHGLIAQEAATVYPAAITHVAEMDWWGTDYSRYVPLLLQEVKAMRNRLRALETR